MKNLKEVAEKIKESDNIILYTDSDLDGVTSGLISKKTLEAIGKEPLIFFTDKEKRGYGLSSESLKMFDDKSPGLLITMDCGISDFSGVREAKKMGFEVIIIDHHKPHEKVPDADIIVCPKLNTDKFKERPNAGIILELSELLLGQKEPEFIELTALAIFGDMMPHKGPNAEVLYMAKQNFPVTVGVESFQEIINVKKPLPLFQEISPILNVTEMISNTPEAFLFFLITEKDHAKILARKMLNAYKRRKDRVEKIKDILLQKNKDQEIIFAGNEDWPSFILGKIASQLVSEVKKPVFIYKKKDEIAQGSVRVPKGYDAVEAMKSSDSILENYGGHPPAAGFTIKVENLDQFEKNLIKYFKNIN